MSSVTSRIREIKQPYGGYIKPKEFHVEKIEDGKILSEKENIQPYLVGITVDYLSRYMSGSRNAFDIPLIGAVNAANYIPGVDEEARELLENVNDLDDKSIICACRLATYDSWYRNFYATLAAPQDNYITPDKDTIWNIRTMVQRSMSFFEKYGPVIKEGFTFEPEGYTETVDTGDGDFLTKDTLWDFKVSKHTITSKHTLQLAMYWIMGLHSGQAVFKSIKKIGVFNPKQNMVYTLNVSNISEKTVKEIEEEVICYR